MKTRNILIGILSLLTFSAYSQSDEKNETEINNTKTELNVTELKFETNSLEGFADLNWNALEEILRKNNPNQEITLSIAYNNDSKGEGTDFLIDDFKIEFNGKSSELADIMSSELKKSLSTLAEIEEMMKN